MPAHLMIANMKCIPIRQLRVFDVAHVEDGGRKLSTLLSLEIDGVRVYSLSLAPIVTPSSGDSTIGMFKSDDPQSIYAWLDPVSKECFIVSGSSPQAILSLAYMAGLFTAAVAGALIHSKFWGTVCGISAAMLCVVASVRSLMHSRKVSAELHARYRQQYGSKPISFLEEDRQNTEQVLTKSD
jgi:hypothetical protein